MQRIAEKLVRRRFFNHLAKVHDENIIRYILYNGKIVRNEHVRKTALLLKIELKVYYLCLN